MEREGKARFGLHFILPIFEMGFGAPRDVCVCVLYVYLRGSWCVGSIHRL